jgi:hypothetical protein
MENETNSAHHQNKTTVKQFCKAHNVHRVAIEFDGYGDDGQVQSVSFLDAEGNELKLNKEPVPIFTNHISYNKDGHQKKTIEIPGTADELMEEMAYSVLDAASPGWEINEGAFGTITINADASGKMDFNQRIQDSVYSEHHF